MPLGMEVGLGPGDIVLDGNPAPPPKKGAQEPSPTFQPGFDVVKRSPIPETAELLLLLLTKGLQSCLGLVSPRKPRQKTHRCKSAGRLFDLIQPFAFSAT